MAWLLLLLAGGAAGYAYMSQYHPLVLERAVLQAYRKVTGQELASARSTLRPAAKWLSSRGQKQASLNREASDARERERDTKSDLETLRSELEKSLKAELEQGSVRILDSRDHMGVRIDEALLFAPGTTQLTGTGQELLLRVAGALTQLPTQTFQVSGHVDRAPVVAPVVRNLYPTKWDLSAARAIQVLLCLQRAGEVAEAQLSAAGFGDQRPVVDKDTGNGRIEITLAGRRPLGATAEADRAASDARDAKRK